MQEVKKCPKCGGRAGEVGSCKRCDYTGRVCPSCGDSALACHGECEETEGAVAASVLDGEDVEPYLLLRRPSAVRGESSCHGPRQPRAEQEGPPLAVQVCRRPK
jgi:hypothetical protein